MFIQVIQARTTETAALERCFRRWHDEVQPGAIGYLGSTEGISPDGWMVVLRRFRDEESARANAARPEQVVWNDELLALLELPVVTDESGDITELRHGDPQNAEFVQVMGGRFTDRERAQHLEEMSDDILGAMRPDLLGITTAYFANGDYATIAYFTNEHEARRNEAMPLPENIPDEFALWDAVMPVERYIDLTRPTLVRADQ